MNLPFLKLRVADYPWILFDRTSDVRGGEAGPEPDWEGISSDICDRSRGAAARGSVVLTCAGSAIRVRTWTDSGSPCAPPPSAVLCASRWLFDAGRAGADSIILCSEYGDSEVLVIDSRNFSLPVGVPESPDGSPLGDAFGARGLELSAASGSGVMVPLRFGQSEADVILFDEPPARRSSRKRPERASRDEKRVEVLAISRRELRVRGGGRDPIVAVAAALAAAVAADYSDRDATVLIGGELLVAQWPEGGPIFVAAAPAYCLSGEFWTTER